MKTMYKKIVMKSMMFLMALGLVFGISSCRDDDNNGNQPGLPEGNNFKITVTVPVIDGSDYVSFISSGGTGNPQESDIWKLNGVVQNGQKVIGLERQNFEGTTKTYVMESTKPLLALSASFNVLNSLQPMTVSYKIEKNGTTVVNENFTLAAGGSQMKNYSY